MKSIVYRAYVECLEKLAAVKPIVHPTFKKVLDAQKPGSRGRSKAITKYRSKQPKKTMPGSIDPVLDK